MTGSIVTRKPQIVTLSSEQDAYELLNDADAAFEPEQDVADAATANHVHDALLRMLAESNDGSGTYREAYEQDWIKQTMSALSTRWNI